MTFNASHATLGRSFEALMGNSDFDEFDSLFSLVPDSSFDELIHSYLYNTGSSTEKVVETPWTTRALAPVYTTSAGNAKSPVKGSGTKCSDAIWQANTHNTKGKGVI